MRSGESSRYKDQKSRPWKPPRTQADRKNGRPTAKKAQADLAQGQSPHYDNAQRQTAEINQRYVEELEGRDCRRRSPSGSKSPRHEVADRKGMEKEVKNARTHRISEAVPEKSTSWTPVMVVEQPDGIGHLCRKRRHGLHQPGTSGRSCHDSPILRCIAKDMTDVTTAGRKGAIEVIDLDDHSAVAQIIDDNVSDPILPGDKIFTPLWKPGQREHFALTCGMDLDDDNRSDIDELRNLITTNNGIVDFWLEDDGTKHGQMTSETDYLVIGERPTDGSTTERINARKAVIAEQKRLNTRTMSLEEMLNRMGYKRQVHVTRYDSKANPNNFRAKAPEGVPRESSGHVSDLFEKRNPPKPAVNSAY